MPQLLFHIFVKSGRFICQDCQHGQCEEMYNNNLIWVWENVRSSWKGSPTVLRLVVQRWDNIRSICQGCQWSVPTDVRTIITYFLLARIRRLTRIDDMKVQVKVAAYHQCNVSQPFEKLDITWMQYMSYNAPWIRVWWENMSASLGDQPLHKRELGKRTYRPRVVFLTAPPPKKKVEVCKT